MSRHLIINARHRLAWHHRLFSDASTAVMWGGWMWLWSPLLRAWAHAGARSHAAAMKLFANGSADAIERAVLALLGTSGVLLVWNRLFARATRQPEALSVVDYARHFDVPEHVLRAGRDAPVCVVQHDESGRIVAVECRDPLARGDARPTVVAQLSRAAPARHASHAVRRAASA
jgi:poly-beta-1,6-N-acetyl-D-glucosamine biosynthesis protein PgaD